MDDLKAEISFFATKIRSVFADDLRALASIPPDAIDAILQNDPFRLSEEALAAVRRQLEFTFSVRQEAGHAVKSDYEPCDRPPLSGPCSLLVHDCLRRHGWL